MKRFVMAAMILLCLTGCRKEAKSIVSDTPEPVPVVIAGETPHRTDIGDIESGTTIIGTIAEESRGASVQVEDMTTQRGDITMVTATVSPPYPPELWVRFQIKTRSGASAIKRLVAVRGKMVRDEQPIAMLQTMLGGPDDPKAGTDRPTEFKVDVLSGLAAPPNSMLVYAEADLLLLPKDTDPAGIDPATANVDPGDSATIRSNPVRINFAAPGESS